MFHNEPFLIIIKAFSASIFVFLIDPIINFIFGFIPENAIKDINDYKLIISAGLVTVIFITYIVKLYKAIKK